MKRTARSGAGRTERDFVNAVLAVVAGITAGSVMSYKQVASAAGRPTAWRVVGNILKRNFDPKIPCHRVILSDGRPGGYNRGRRRKTQLLLAESAGSRLACGAVVSALAPYE